jgi:hypothetical protein
LRVAGELVGSYAGPEDLGYFDTTAYGRDYGRDGLRLLALALTAELRFGGRVTLVGELRSENLDAPRLQALYLRLRPVEHRAFDLQVGRIPPVFGTYASRSYGAGNPLVGQPLVYQYLTSLRHDAVPATLDGFRRTRGSGWAPHYPIGSQAQQTGLPISNPLLWDTGAELRVGKDPVTFALAVTRGSLSRPHASGDAAGPSLTGRLGWRPAFGVQLGLSGAHGAYAAEALLETLGTPGQSADQTAFGLDASWAGGPWIVRAEGIASAWQVPSPSGVPETVRSRGGYLEARRSLGPRFYAAGRFDHLGFTAVEGATGRFAWDAPVTRLEVAIGLRPLRRAWLKLAYQHNWRDAGRIRSEGYLAGQLWLWF